MSSFVLKLFSKKRFVKSVNVFPARIKLIKPIQKYLHIIELNACTLKIFVLMSLLLINLFISLGIYSTPKESN